MGFEPGTTELFFVLPGPLKILIMYQLYSIEPIIVFVR